MKVLIDFLLGILKKFLTFAVLFAVIVFVWNIYKDKREARTFISQFSDIHGLSKGAPILSKGIEVGKVIKICPISNSNKVGVKGLITKSEFPLPKGSVNTRIITNFSSGGGKALELLEMNYESQLEQIGLREKNFLDENKKFKKAIDHPSTKIVLRILKDTFQMTKDFAQSFQQVLNSSQSLQYQAEVKNIVNNTITSLEYGTLKQDLQRSIKNLDRDIESYEKKPNKHLIVERNLKNQATALKNTIDSYANLSTSYHKAK
jgi:hypothetical protein